MAKTRKRSLAQQLLGTCVRFLVSEHIVKRCERWDKKSEATNDAQTKFKTPTARRLGTLFGGATDRANLAQLFGNSEQLKTNKKDKNG